MSGIECPLSIGFILIVELDPRNPGTTVLRRFRTNIIERETYFVGCKSEIKYQPICYSTTGHGFRHRNTVIVTIIEL